MNGCGRSPPTPVHLRDPDPLANGFRYREPELTIRQRRGEPPDGGRHHSALTALRSATASRPADAPGRRGGPSVTASRVGEDGFEPSQPERGLYRPLGSPLPSSPLVEEVVKRARRVRGSNARGCDPDDGLASRRLTTRPTLPVLHGRTGIPTSAFPIRRQACFRLHRPALPGARKGPPGRGCSPWAARQQRRSAHYEDVPPIRELEERRYDWTRSRVFMFALLPGPVRRDGSTVQHHHRGGQTLFGTPRPTVVRTVCFDPFGTEHAIPARRPGTARRNGGAMTARADHPARDLLAYTPDADRPTSCRAAGTPAARPLGGGRAGRSGVRPSVPGAVRISRAGGPGSIRRVHA